MTRMKEIVATTDNFFYNHKVSGENDSGEHEIEKLQLLFFVVLFLRRD